MCVPDRTPPLRYNEVVNRWERANAMASPALADIVSATRWHLDFDPATAFVAVRLWLKSVGYLAFDKTETSTMTATRSFEDTRKGSKSTKAAVVLRLHSCCPCGYLQTSVNGNRLKLPMSEGC